MDKWLAEFFETKLNSPAEELVAEVLWQVWKNRNNQVFRDRKSSTKAIIETSLAQNHTYQRWNPRRRKETTKMANLPVKWIAPEDPYLKLNVDCSWVEGDAPSSIAGMLRDSNGIIVDGFATEVHASSSLQAETLALLHGLYMLKQREEKQVGQVHKQRRCVLCESDCRTLVQLILGREEAPWAMKDQVQDCQMRLAQLTNASLAYCSREAKSAVDWIAKAHRRKLLPSMWKRNPPNPLWTILCSESNLSFHVKPTF
ncbi:hypothetical protein ACJRO7_019791 [Eucalyptus globulus]|uniref:RNase H type-1 domain-containing protein n=1 Tax=Eucalyptus globulus TaxID=34317 RepID=A0ABD3KG48_EUCGL